ncbi:MAG: citrate/2-methylcitrate synthase [Candidatus Heimdallarchaeota archaeon]|nr:citrate/2-methylcitrate synthase [Candidatus Heimdallarchaeota archaeon]
MREDTKEITKIVLKAAEKARNETSTEPEPSLTRPANWPIDCVVGPGLEGAIACESKVGYVNGSKGCLVYRGYDVFDLCANSTYEEVSYLLMHGQLPSTSQFKEYKKTLVQCRDVPGTVRLLLNFPIEDMHPMAALRLGINLMRQEFTYEDQLDHKPDGASSINTDEDGIAMETVPQGEEHAVYEFRNKKSKAKLKLTSSELESAASLNSCYRLISGTASIAAAVNRIRQKHFPIEANPELSHAANLIYMMTGKIPTPEEERIMDISLILHADHGMNASTFAAMVVASTLSDIYFSVGSGVAALSGPLHGGANEQVVHMLQEIGDVKNVEPWLNKSLANKRKITGFGHRVYKTYDPRARVLSPLAKHLAKRNKEMMPLFKTAQCLEKKVVSTLGKEKKIFPNVDYYSGLVYQSLGISPEMFTPIFSVSRVSGWTARVTEYLQNNRIFRPRAMYVGPFNKQYVSLQKRAKDISER